jgi:hypothetical protein
VSEVVFSPTGQRRTPLVRLYDQIKQQPHQCKHNLVVAKSTNDVKTAVKIMNAEKTQTMVRLHNINMNIKKAQEARSEHLKDRRYGMYNNNENRRLLAEKRIYERHLKAIEKVKDNLHGEILKLVILQGGNSFQGLDIQALRHVHIIDHMTTHKRHKQLLGRGARGFGHAKLNKKNQDVHLVQYHMQAPPEFEEGFASIEIWVNDNLRSLFKGKNETAQLSNQKKFLQRVKRGLRFLQKYKMELLSPNNKGTPLTENSPVTIMSLNDIMPNHRNKKQSVQNLKTLERYMRQP